MNTLQIATEDGRTQFEPSDSVPVIAQWQLDERVEAMEVRLVWYTLGKGDQDIEIVSQQRLEGPQLADTWRLSLPLPAAPYSFSGKLISLVWCIELHAPPLRDSTRLDITVAPAGREVLLHHGSDTPE